MNSKKNILIVSSELSIQEHQLEAVAALLSENATVPFIARYRKEMTGSLDEVQVIAIRDRLETLFELDARRETILSSLTEQGKLTPELEKAVREAETLSKREDLKKVPGMGPKSFEQAAGFLRIRNAKNPLDASAVHPERYSLVEQMAQDILCSVRDLMDKNELREKIDLKKYVTGEVGLPTLKDIALELARPGRDPRKEFELFSYDESVHSINDLKPGMKLPGVITNVAAFGAFVDIGVHQDGLVHISQLADSFVNDPNKVVKVNQKVMVTVTEVDVLRKRISLSMKSNPDESPAVRRTEVRSETAHGKKIVTPSKSKAPIKNEKSSSTSNPFSGLSGMLKK